MTATQRRVVAGFIAALAGFALAMGAFDVYLATTAADATNTFSWALQVWADEHPRQFAALLAGFFFVVGFVIAHIWYGQPTAKVWDAASRVEAYASRVAHLESVAASKDRDLALERLARNAAEKRCEEVKFALSDCLAGRHPFPRIADIPES